MALWPGHQPVAYVGHRTEKPSTLGQREGWLHWLSYGPLADVAGLRIGDVALIACLWSRAAGLVADDAGDRVIGLVDLNL